MKKSFIIKSLLIGAAFCVVPALLVNLFNGKDFLQVLLSTNNLIFGGFAAISSGIGFGLWAKEHAAN